MGNAIFEENQKLCFQRKFKDEICFNKNSRELTWITRRSKNARKQIRNNNVQNPSARDQSKGQTQKRAKKRLIKQHKKAISDEKTERKPN